MADVFISYKRQERARCKRIADKLSGLGLKVWFDDQLEAGESFGKRIEKVVEQSKAVLVLWSKTSVDSQWVRNEANVGKDDKKLVAVQIEECKLPLEFRDVHFEQLINPNFQDDDPAWLKIIDRIGKLTDRPEIVSFSQALARAAVPLEEWARLHPTDPLALRMREKANLLGGETPQAAAANARKSKAATLITIGLVALAVGAGAGAYGVMTFMPPQAVAGQVEGQPPVIVERTLQEEAAPLVGRYSLENDPTCANARQVAVVWLGSTSATSAPTLRVMNEDVELGSYRVESRDGEWVVAVDPTDNSQMRLKRDANGLAREGDPDTLEACTS